MLMNASGHLQVTVVDGTTLTGIFAADGSLNVFDATNETGFVGLQHPCGAINCVSSSGTTLTGAQAPNGAYYVVNDSAEIGLRHSSGGLCVTGFTTMEAVSFLSTWGPYGIVMDFTDASIAINDAADLLDFTSQGQVSGGALVGPGAKTTYSGPSVKLTEKEDGSLKFQAHNLYLNSASPANQSITVLSGASYAITITGSVSMVASGAATGTWTAGTTTFTAATGTLTLGSTSGSGTVHLRRTPSVDTYIATTSAAAYDIPYVWSGGVRRLRNEAAATNLALWASHLEITHALTVTGGSGTFADGETVTASGGGTAVYQSSTSTSTVFTLRTGSGTFSGTLTGGTSGATRTISSAALIWTPSNLTTSYTATGPDGVANSASTLTATAANATALQAITSASSSRLTSVYIKRRTGSGNIDLTQDNGTTWTTQTVTSSWTRVALAAVTSTNPTVGIRIVTSGDAVDVWCFQHETGTVATSPIITYGAAVARAADDLQIPNAQIPAAVTELTIAIKYRPVNAVIGTIISFGTLSSGGVHGFYQTSSTLYSFSHNGVGTQALLGAPGSVGLVSGELIKAAARFKASDFAIDSNKGAVLTQASGAYAAPTGPLRISGNQFSGVFGTADIEMIAVFPAGKTDAELDAIITAMGA